MAGLSRSSTSGVRWAAVWRGQKSWNGVAILACGSEPIVTRAELRVISPVFLFVSA
jgi:hypothetical protein